MSKEEESLGTNLDISPVRYISEQLYVANRFDRLMPAGIKLADKVRVFIRTPNSPEYPGISPSFIVYEAVIESVEKDQTGLLTVMAHTKNKENEANTTRLEIDNTGIYHARGWTLPAETGFLAPVEDSA